MAKRMDDAPIYEVHKIASFRSASGSAVLGLGAHLPGPGYHRCPRPVAVVHH
jgi:hypothetical protein